jgi:hypothetical protein
MKFKKAQEEMLGFVLIIIIVAVIILIFLGFVFSGREKIRESHQVSSFVQVFLNQVTSCEQHLGPLKIQSLIFECMENGHCLDGNNACEILNQTIENIMREVWKLENRPEKGYSFLIQSEGDTIISLEKGNQTNNYEYGWQSFQRRGRDVEISLNVYY